MGINQITVWWRGVQLQYFALLISASGGGVEGRGDFVYYTEPHIRRNRVTSSHTVHIPPPPPPPPPSPHHLPTCPLRRWAGREKGRYFCPYWLQGQSLKLGEGNLHELIYYKDTKAKFRNPTKLTCKGTLRQVFICMKPPPPRFCYGWSRKFVSYEAGQIQSWTRE
jgi:hypothetical protein